MENKLLYYQGGGYAGCIWEWNFCLWDANGIWHNLYASGCDGCFEYSKENFEHDKLKDLVFQAFCTGEPDIFSEELRDYWS